LRNTGRPAKLAWLSRRPSLFRGWRKAELHSHLDGAVRPATAGELATQQGLDLPRPLRLVAPDDCPSQAEYLRYFEHPIAVMQTEEALTRVAYELTLDSAAENIDYLEVRWAPRLHMREGLNIGQIIDAVLAGLSAGPIRAVAIVCAMRQHDMEDNLGLAKIAGGYAGKGVVGFDLAGDEVRYAALPQRRAFEAARAVGLHTTCHAGEAGDPANVEEAMLIGVERIAHGVIGARDERIVQLLRSEGMVLDICPTANWKCKAVSSLKEHPLPRLVRGGIRCTISTDSRTVADTDLSWEFELAARMGLTSDELKAVNQTAYDARFDR
jgi:adenosine deaminase